VRASGGLQRLNRLTAALAGLGIAASLVACVGPRLAAVPGAPIELSGRWTLDAAASDDVAALIAKAIPKRRPIRPLEGDQMPSADARPQSGGRRGGNDGNPVQAAEPAPAWGHVRPTDFVASFVQPPLRLDIVQMPGQFEVVGDGRKRTFAPGDTTPYSVTDRYGSRRVHAGWNGAEFDIVSEDGTRLHVVEHLARGRGEGLEMTTEFSAQGMKSFAVHAVYRRATAAELNAPQEGPPRPAAR